MLTEQRYQQILRLLQQRGSVTVAEVQQLLGVSESTARRDISSLDKAGRLVKVFGGAVLQRDPVTAREYTVAQKSDLNLEEKRRIGRYAAALITQEDFVYLDAGTTTAQVIAALDYPRGTFVTNAVAHAQRLAAKGCRVFLLGGELKSSTEAIIGSQAMRALQEYHFTKGFFGVNGISRKEGCMTPDPNEASIKRAAMQQCWKSYLLCDHTKFENLAPVTFSPFAGPTFITDRRPKGYEGIKQIISLEELRQEEQEAAQASQSSQAAQPAE